MKKPKRVIITATGPQGGGKTLCLQILHKVLVGVDVKNLEYDLEKHEISFDVVNQDIAGMLARNAEE